MKCDFCSAPPPLLRYPVQTGTPWAACQECALLIDAGELLPLVRRIIRQLVRPQLLPRAARDAHLGGVMVQQLAEWLHSAFWTQRDGAAQPFAAFPTTRTCPACRWALRPEDPDGECPRCGTPLAVRP